MNRWRWDDVALIALLVLLVPVASWNATRVPAELPHACSGPCDWKNGDPCGCAPDNGNCVMPCNGCCQAGCWPSVAPEESAR